MVVSCFFPNFGDCNAQLTDAQHRPLANVGRNVLEQRHDDLEARLDVAHERHAVGERITSVNERFDYMIVYVHVHVHVMLAHPT